MIRIVSTARLFLCQRVDDALQKLQFDLFYIKNQSLLFDLSILFQTIKTVVLRKGT